MLESCLSVPSKYLCCFNAAEASDETGLTRDQRQGVWCWCRSEAYWLLLRSWPFWIMLAVTMTCSKRRQQHDETQSPLLSVCQHILRWCDMWGRAEEAWHQTGELPGYQLMQSNYWCCHQLVSHSNGPEGSGLSVKEGHIAPYLILMYLCNRNNHITFL